MARLRHHGTLCIAAWLPGLRKGDDSPLSTTSRREPRETCATRRLPTPRRSRSGRNVTSPTRSPPYTADWRWRSLERCRDAHAARVASRVLSDMPYDTVRLLRPTPQGPRCGRLATVGGGLLGWGADEALRVLTGQRFCHSVPSLGSSGPSSRAAPVRARGVIPAPALRLVP